MAWTSQLTSGTPIKAEIAPRRERRMIGGKMTTEERLEKLEQELSRAKRRSRWLLGAVLLMAGGLVVPGVLEMTAFQGRAQGARMAQEMRANKFVLVDENGKLHAELAMYKGSPILLLWDGNGTPRAALVVSEHGPSLMLNDEKGNPRFVAGTTSTVTPDGKTIPYPESSLILFGPDGKAIWSATK